MLRRYELIVLAAVFCSDCLNQIYIFLLFLSHGRLAFYIELTGSLNFFSVIFVEDWVYFRVPGNCSLWIVSKYFSKLARARAGSCPGFTTWALAFFFFKLFFLVINQFEAFYVRRFGEVRHICIKEEVHQLGRLFPSLLLFYLLSGLIFYNSNTHFWNLIILYQLSES